MKKFLSFIVLISLVIASCSKSVINEDASFSIDYSFSKSVGNLKSASTDYSAFHAKYIEGKIATPKFYSLQFVGKTKGNKLSVNGKWGNLDIVTLPTDTYVVTGESYPYYENGTISDTCYIKFNTEVQISPNTTSITIGALYDCYLLAFSPTLGFGTYGWETISPIDASTIFHGRMLGNSEYFSYLFVKEAPAGGRINISSATIYNDSSWTIGKYYYYSSASANYSLPLMSPGF